MYKFLNKWTRKLHRWGAILTCVPLLLVILTGLLLQVKKQVTWVQPPTLRGSVKEPAADWSRLLTSCQQDPNAGIKSWADINRLDVQPAKGVVKVQASNHWELQLDLADGRILSSAYRRSDWIEQLHDGSFFGDWAKLWLFLPNGIVLLGLWIPGAYLWYLPFYAKRKKQKSKLQAVAEES
jgi:uncharacterized iron-regulated membrane protein